VDGAAARAVVELARDRWRTATGQSLAPIDAAHVVWPRGLEPILHDIDVVIDDRLLRVGSSNLNDRSMGFDSDCDLAIEAYANTPEHEDTAARSLQCATNWCPNTWACQSASSSDHTPYQTSTAPAA
jgi:hypothetical protein